MLFGLSAESVPVCHPAQQRALDARRVSGHPGQGDEEILDDAVALSGVSRYPARVKCALLGWMAYRDALGRQTEQHQE